MAKSALAQRLEQRKKAINTTSPGSVSDEVTQPKARSLKLSSGKVVELELYTFNGQAHIESDTAVDSSNIRNQDQLTAESLQDILASIENVQLYPAIGYIDNEMVKIVDGSRRRKAAIIRDCQYSVEVANCKLSQKDAEEIVRISEQKRKLSYAEWGRFYQAKLDNGIYPDAKTMAESEGVSTGFLSLCINAAKVPSGLLNLFVDSSLVASQKNTKLLIDVSKALDSQDIELKDFIDNIEDELILALERACTPEEHTELVLSILAATKGKLKRKNSEKSKKVKPENLGGGITFSVKSKDSAVINLRKVSEEKRNKIKEFIRELML
ncbi:ParB N-terminal domain-containing protein [Vibrio campbellii]|jgi:ParB family chromosome partitioning protein|uniref:ParB N-terminal domain-containing protein n=1 Tax=Vibrio campbellii TaxID=680 RepID=UPI0003A72345|nr:ParB N-terminal domain-containing protein [Vibrio campbellii]MCR9907725.1 ParB N-terminal domain-containing protein [Vibrio campbellii]